MPAAAVIPAPIAYIKVVAVKKLVVGFLASPPGRPRKGSHSLARVAILGGRPPGIKLSGGRRSSFTVNKLECSKQA